MKLMGSLNNVVTRDRGNNLVVLQYSEIYKLHAKQTVTQLQHLQATYTNDLKLFKCIYVHAYATHDDSFNEDTGTQELSITLKALTGFGKMAESQPIAFLDGI